ncbi:hypothetical protein TSUD_363420, partial [Trifolium subterraneum]
GKDDGSSIREQTSYSFPGAAESEKKKPHPKRPYHRRESMLEVQAIPPSKNGGMTIGDIARARGREVFPLHFLVECATGYALFLAHGINDIDMLNYRLVEEYINRSDTPFELKSYLPFSSLGEALIQMNAISNSSVTEMLINFIRKNFEPPFHRHVLTTADPVLGEKIVNNLRLSDHTSILTYSVMRGLREKIDKLIGLHPGELDKAQRQLAHLYKDQKRTILDTKSPVPISSSSFLQEQVMKPGSRVMYVGKVCGLTVSDLSDLVGLVYLDGRFIVNNVHHYLKTGGHYMICTKADNMNSKGHIIFSSGDINKEFKLLQTVPLDLVEGAYFVDIGGYRLQPE